MALRVPFTMLRGPLVQTGVRKLHSSSWSPFDGYEGPVAYSRTDDGRQVVPIFRITREFVVGAENCTRTQFPLVTAYAITVHKSQSITKTQIATDISSRDFPPGLSYVAVSRVIALRGFYSRLPSTGIISPSQRGLLG